MAPDIMTLFAVIPIDQETVQARVDCRARPIAERLERRRGGQGVISGASVEIISIICLLPSGCFDPSSVRHDLVEILRMRPPKILEFGFLWFEIGRELSGEQRTVIVQSTLGESRICVSIH